MWTRRASSAAAFVSFALAASNAFALSAPTHVQGAPQTPTSVLVTWQDNSSDEHYQVVERSANGTSGWASISGSLAANQTSYIDATPPLTEGTQYFYRVRACRNACNNSSTRKISAASPGVTTPLVAPTGPSAVYGPTPQVALAWTDASTRNTAYQVERKATVDASWQTLTSSLGADATGYTDAAPLDGRTYDYRITAIRTTAPTSESSGSLASASTPWNAPTGLSAALDDQARPVLSWTDNSSGELAYAVERRNDLAVYDCPVASQRGDGWCEVAQAPPNPSGGATTYVDASLRVDPADPAEYQYRVHAIAGSSTSADTVAWSPSCTGASPANPLLTWSDTRIANGSVPWPLAIPAPSDTTIVSAAKLTSGTWASCNAGGTGGTLPPTPPAGCAWSACTLGETGCTSPELILLSNSRYLALFTWRGALMGLTHRLHGMEFIHPRDALGDFPHGWQIEVGAATTKVNSGTHFQSQPGSTPNPAISVDTASGVALRFFWTGIPNMSATVENLWRLDGAGSSGLRARIAVDGTAAAGFPIDVHFPQITQLTYNWTDEGVIVPRGPGGVHTNDVDGGTLLTPGWTAQYFGFARGQSALYVAAEDPAQRPKLFNYNKPVLTDFVFFPEAVVAPENQEFSMDYDVVLAPMCAQSQGEAPIRVAKRYRRFMLASDWLKQPSDPAPVRLVERTDIPAKVRDGMYWWTYNLRTMTVHNDAISYDVDGNNPRIVGVNPATGQGGCGNPTCSVLCYKNGAASCTPGVSNYYRLAFKDLSQPGQPVYVFPGDVQGPPANRLYVDPVADPNWHLFGTRQLATLFDVGATQTRDMLLYDTRKWACYLRTSLGSNTPIGFHLYWWYRPGFDWGNPSFDMVPGVDLGIEAIEGAQGPWSFDGTSCGPVAAGDNFVLPYINAGWGDASAIYPGPKTNLDYDRSDLVLPMAMRLEAGQHWCINGNCALPPGKQMLIRMSGGIPEWRDYVAGIAANVFGPVGSSGIYLDTYGGGFHRDAIDAPLESYDLPRDHLPGRGLWHTTGEREIANGVRQEKPGGVGVVAAEHASEAFLTNVDLITWYPYVRPTDVPLMQAVYGGYRMFAGPIAAANASESVDAYAMKAATTFVSGNQQGITNSTPFSPLNEFHKISANGVEMLAYSNRLAKSRLDLKCFMAYGEYLGASDPDAAVAPAQTITLTWQNWDGSPPFPNVTRTRIRGSRWVSSAGGGCSAGRAIVLTNSTTADEQAHIPVPSAWAGTSPLLCQSDDTGCTAIALEPAAGGGWQTATLSVPARDVRYLRFGP